MELEKFSYDHCHTLCTDYYGWHECLLDCITYGYHGAGQCASLSPKQFESCNKGRGGSTVLPTGARAPNYF
ncbi:hypothetical protein Bca52824_019323 [Brassica carinata]|uniref:Defensin-like domain-containing protein n=1 Tax=Brassica carinata TaxID=52824 RepID=A0A8X7VRC6_BRACI|nr:hypothetical protein Bca52824_019323 [Brassica carinata]